MNKQKKYLKKIWCLLLAVSLVMSMTPAMAFAEDGENTAASTATVTFTSQADNAFLHGPQLDTAVRCVYETGIPSASLIIRKATITAS